MHPWHDVPLDESRIEELVPAVIEVPRGSRNKYELDKETGLLRLDRVLYGAIHYPTDYGFVPRTLGGDGDALDVLVLMQEPVVPLAIVDTRLLGVLPMRDDKGEDAKLVAVALGDPAYADVESFDDLPRHVMRQIDRFFRDYKQLEGKTVDVDAIQDRNTALDILRDGLERYRVRPA